MIHWSWVIAGFAIGGWYGFVMSCIARKEKDDMEVIRMISAEDPNTEYLCFPDIRLIFREGEYAGWYFPG